LTAAVLAVLAITVVLLPAFFGVGRPRIYAWIGFLGVIAGGVMLIATPTPPGFDPNGAAHRWLISAAVGQDLGAALLATGVAGLLGAFAVGRSEQPEETEVTDVD
jgi:drug/metabolite transporter (DMT)-like permease